MDKPTQDEMLSQLFSFHLLAGHHRIPFPLHIAWTHQAISTPNTWALLDVSQLDSSPPSLSERHDSRDTYLNKWHGVMELYSKKILAHLDIDLPSLPIFPGHFRTQLSSLAVLLRMDQWWHLCARRPTMSHRDHRPFSHILGLFRDLTWSICGVLWRSSRAHAGAHTPSNHAHNQKHAHNLVIPQSACKKLGPSTTARIVLAPGLRKNTEKLAHCWGPDVEWCRWIWT